MNQQNTLTTLRRPVMLLILDGFGFNPSETNNAIALANTPNLDKLFSQWPSTLIHTSGKHVGLPDGQMGNSEVGHMTLGCGSIIRQDLVSINEAINNGDFFQNPVLLEAIGKAKALNRPIHLLGLVSDGGVHSHISHLIALIQLCDQHDVKPALHVITDGRDTAPQSALKYLEQITPYLKQANGYIATLSGRYYAMDRDKRWERTEKVWRTMMLASGNKAESAIKAIQLSYAKNITDEFIQPVTLPGHTPLDADDQIICFNFRKDRPRQLVAALSLPHFQDFDRGDFPLPQMTCLMPYDSTYNLPFAFTPEKPATTLASVISQQGIAQFHCAETEKYAHVTYFFNGGHNTLFSGENHILIPSPSVSTYDQNPAMSAKEVADAVTSAIASNKYGFIVVNFANGDMVGHTGKLDAAIHAVEVLDTEVGRLFETAEQNGFSVILTADHGNCESMTVPNSSTPHTQHTTNPVPCLIMDEEYWQLTDEGGLANIAPTILQLMGIPKPVEMQADSLLLESEGKAESRYRLDGAA